MKKLLFLLIIVLLLCGCCEQNVEVNCYNCSQNNSIINDTPLEYDTVENKVYDSDLNDVCKKIIFWYDE